MSYNIDSIDIVAQEDFWLEPEAFQALCALIGEMPEGWHGTEADVADDISRGTFPWYGEWSGRSYDTLCGTVLPAFHGSADLILCWEGGDSYTGLRLRDGTVSHHRVIMTLGEEQ